MAQWYRTNSGILTPTAPQRKPVGIDLFCGCGGFSLGYIQAGWDVIAACDNDPTATLTYLINLGAYPVDIHYVTSDDKDRLDAAAEQLVVRDKQGFITSMPVSGSNRRPGFGDGVQHFWFGDIRQVSGADILRAIGMERGEVDCVFGGPPCQGYSVSGRRDVMDPRSSLVFDFARLVVEIQPKTLCMENVPGILSMTTPEGIPVVDALCHILEEGGFGTYNALKKTLSTTSGAGAAIRTKRPSKPGPKIDKDIVGNEQMSLF